jgi:hypothetical protein
MKNWSRVPNGSLTPRQTGRLIVGRNVTSTSIGSVYQCGGGLEYLLRSPCES